MTSRAALAAASGGQWTITTRWGSMVTGGAEGAGTENWMPLRSMRVEGPGTWRVSMPSMKRAARMSMASEPTPARVRSRHRRAVDGVPAGGPRGPPGHGVAPETPGRQEFLDEAL